MFGKGMEMMLLNVIKSMGLDPVELRNTFDEMKERVIGAIEQHEKDTAIIKSDLDAIKRHLGITNIEGITNEQEEQKAIAPISQDGNDTGDNGLFNWGNGSDDTTTD